MSKEVDSLFYKAAREMQGAFNLPNLIKKFNSIGGKGIPYSEHGFHGVFDYMRNLPFLKPAGYKMFYELNERYRKGGRDLSEEEQLILQVVRRMMPSFLLADLTREYHALHKNRPLHYRKHGYQYLDSYLKSLPFIKEAMTYAVYNLDQSYIPEESEEEVVTSERESSVVSLARSHVSEASLSHVHNAKESKRILRLARALPTKFLRDLCIAYRLNYKTPVSYDKYGYSDELEYLRSQPFLVTDGDKYCVKERYLASSEDDTEDDREEINGVLMPTKNEENYVHIGENKLRYEESIPNSVEEQNSHNGVESDRVDEAMEDRLVLAAVRTLPAIFHLQILLDRYRFLHENREIPYAMLGFTCEREYIDQLPFLKTAGFQQYKLDTKILATYDEEIDSWTQKEQAAHRPPTIHSEQTKKITNCYGEDSQITEQSNNANNTTEDKENSYKQITEANLILEAAREPPTIFTLWTLMDRYRRMHKRMVPLAELGFKSLEEYVLQLPFINRRDYDEYELDMSYMLSVYGEQEGWWSQTQRPSRFALNYGQNMEEDESHRYHNNNGNSQVPKVTLKEGESLKIHAIVSRFAFDFTETDILDRYRILYNAELPLEHTGYPTVSQYLSSLSFLEELPGGRGFRRIDRDNSVELKNFENTEESDAESVKTAIESQNGADSSEDSDITISDENNKGDRTISDENETKEASDEYETALDEQEDEEPKKEEPKDPKEMDKKKLKKSQIYGKYISTMMEQAEEKGVDVDELAHEILVLMQGKL